MRTHSSAPYIRWPWQLGCFGGLPRATQNRLLVYQEPVLIAISEFRTLATSCSFFSEQYQGHSGTKLQLQRLKQYLKRRQYKEDLAS